MSDHLDRLRSRLRALQVTSPPSPWRHVGAFAVGGLLCAGTVSLALDREFVMVVSSSGRGVFDAATGEKVARDRAGPEDSELDELGLTVAGIGPLAGRRIRVAGIWGGGLPSTTSDGWSVTVVAPDWPLEMVVLERPGAWVMSERLATGCVLIDRPVSEIRAVGFSESGRVLVEATASDLALFVR